MIYTLTINPSIDYHMSLETALIPGRINRSAGEKLFPGGKGINVSIMLSRLGVPSIAQGFLAGKSGDLLDGLCRDQMVQTSFVRLPAGETRINVKLDEREKETAVNGKGPVIPAEAAGKFADSLSELSEGDYYVISGNIPDENFFFYEMVLSEVTRRKARLVVDTSGKALKAALAYHPFLIKPNKEELFELFDSYVTSERKMKELMTACQAKGAANVLLSCGGEGAWLLTRKGKLYQAEIQGKHSIVSTVGAGDSLLAGFLAGCFPGDEIKSTASRLILACAAGTATACTSWLAGAMEVKEKMQNISVKLALGS